MRIGFLAPVNGVEEYGVIYRSIVAFLVKKGHDVIHPLSFNDSMLSTWTQDECHHFFQEYFTQVNKCDLVIAECSYPCISIGYEIANATQQGKEVIILKTKATAQTKKSHDFLYRKKNISIYEYNAFNLKNVIQEALTCNSNQKYVKYNILFPPEMVAKLNDIARKKNLPKSVYIRQLLEKGLASDE